MDIYRRYASREHDKRHFTQLLASGHIKLRPLSSCFDTPESGEYAAKTIDYWRSVFENAAFFVGADESLFGPVLTVVYKNPSTDKLCTLSVSKYGCNVYENLILDSSSRFWPACENLPENMRRSNVRRALAVSNLKNYNQLWNNKGLVQVTQHWDETNAGALAASMESIDLPARDLGEKLLSLGLIQDQTIPSLMVDVVYANPSDPEDSTTAAENNKLVMHLGEQLEQLFDPLLEYSPQAMDIEYKTPENPTKPVLGHNENVQRVIEELLTVQANYTTDLVDLLQNFIIPLRVSVLSSSSSSGMMKVNLAFPPTIDEITRVNCIVHDLLNRASKYGYVEIFKVLGSFLRFFYKAFVRHEANLANFNSRFEKFVSHNYAYAFESETINAHHMTPRSIKTSIAESILELPRLKLIIKRLYETVKEEKAKAQNFEDSSFEDSNAKKENDDIDNYYAAAMQVIDSFGYNETQPSPKTRVFTPSGKILTELATEWPTELQYGWLSRKVVGIFNLLNVKRTSDSLGLEVAIIFSDHVLFLEILEPSSSEITNILPDILMNSLVNQKPLPKLSTFPKLRVKYWCQINDLEVRRFESANGHCISFTTLNGNHFKNRDATEILFLQVYEIPLGKDSLDICNRIMDLVSKAQVLCKSTPFHLFKHEEGDLQRYFCAHEISVYEKEVSKSPIVLLLNMEESDLTALMRQNNLIFFAVSVTLLNEHTVNLLGQDRQENLKIEEIVALDDLKVSLKEIVSKAIDAMFHSSYFSTILTDGNWSCLEFFIDTFCHKNEENDTGKVEEENNDVTHTTPKIEHEIKSSNSPKISHANTPKTEVRRSGKSERRKSGLFKLLGIFKNKEQPIKAQKTRSERERYIADTPIPRGKSKVYKKLYKPDPLLRDASIASSVPATPAIQLPGNTESQVKIAKRAEVSLDAKAVTNDTTLKAPDQNDARNVSQGTTSSSNYSESLDVNAQFKFPAAPQEENTLHQSTIEEETLKQPGSVDTTVYSPLDDAAVVVNQGEDVEKKFVEDENEVVEFVMPKPSMLDVGKVRASDALVIKLSPKKEEPAAKRVASSQEIANALDNITAIGVLPEVHDRYKMYDAIPNSIFSSDGTSNWVSLARENSSNLEAEIRAMKEEAHMDTEDVIDVAPLYMRAQAYQFDTSTGTTTSGDHYTGDSHQDSIRIHHLPVLREMEREESVQSLTPEQIVQQFESQLDQDFDLDGVNLDRSISMTLSTKLDPIDGDLSPGSETLLDGSLNFGDRESESLISSSGSTKIVPHASNYKENALGQRRQLLSSNPNILLAESLQVENHSTSDEEFFSSSDFIHTVSYFIEQDGGAKKHNLSRSLSSERTLQNELHQPVKEETLSLGLRLESVAFLSDILNGNLEL